jgi:hypothetical protein
MRAWTIGLACSLLFGMASVAPAMAEETEAATESADEATEAEAEPAEESAEESAGESSGIADYGKHVANTFLAGLNGVITWPADPVMLAIEPTDDMRSLPGGVVTGPMVGFFAGTLQGAFRLFTGTLDVALAPLSFFPMFSIEPRYKLIPGWEHAG